MLCAGMLGIYSSLWRSIESHRTNRTYGKIKFHTQRILKQATKKSNHFVRFVSQSKTKSTLYLYMYRPLSTNLEACMWRGGMLQCKVLKTQAYFFRPNRKCREIDREIDRELPRGKGHHNQFPYRVPRPLIAQSMNLIVNLQTQTARVNFVLFYLLARLTRKGPGFFFYIYINLLTFRIPNREVREKNPL